MGGVIKVFISALFGGAMISLPTIIKRVLISLGVGIAVFTGLNALLDNIKFAAFSNLQGVPSVAANIIGILNIDTAFSIVLSAYAIRLTMRTMGGLTMKQVGIT